jgi:hypothetical protein
MTLLFLGAGYFIIQYISVNYINPWKVLGVIALILLIIYFNKGQNAVWGGITYGIGVGIALFLLSALFGKGFEWLIIIKVIILGVILGFIYELPAVIYKPKPQI